MVSLSLKVPATTTSPPRPPATPPAPPTPPAPLPDPEVESDPQEVLSGEYEEGGFFLIPVAGGENTSYGGRPINVSVNRDEGLPSDSNPAIIVSGDILERVNEITFDLFSEASSPQAPPSGFRVAGFTAEIDLAGVELSEEETVTVCLPPAEGEEESGLYHYDEESGEWRLLEPQQLQMVNGEELLCGETDAFSLFAVFIPVIYVIESPEGGIRYSGDVESGFSFTPEGAGTSISYGDSTIDIFVTRDEGLPSGANPAVIVPGDIFDRADRITFDLLSEVSLQQPPPPGLRLEGFAAEVDLVGVELSEEESVTVCLPPAEDEEESDIYRYNEVSEEWELLGSRPKRVNGEDLVCAETDAFSLTGVFVEEEETDGGGCAIAAGSGEAGTGWSENTVFNLLLTISVLLLIPGKSLFRH